MNRKITGLLLLAYTTWHVLATYYGRNKEESIHIIQSLEDPWQSKSRTDPFDSSERDQEQ